MSESISLYPCLKGEESLGIQLNFTYCVQLREESTFPHIEAVSRLITIN